jgi:hypothetical protein
MRLGGQEKPERNAVLVRPLSLLSLIKMTGEVGPAE